MAEIPSTRSIEKWLRQCARRYYPAKSNQQRFLDAARLIARLRHEITNLNRELDTIEYDIDEPLRKLQWDNERLRIALRGSHAGGESEADALARYTEIKASDKEARQ